MSSFSFGSAANAPWTVLVAKGLLWLQAGLLVVEAVTWMSVGTLLGQGGSLKLGAFDAAGGSAVAIGLGLIVVAVAFFLVGSAVGRVSARGRYLAAGLQVAYAAYTLINNPISGDLLTLGLGVVVLGLLFWPTPNTASATGGTAPAGGGDAASKAPAADAPATGDSAPGTEAAADA